MKKTHIFTVDIPKTFFETIGIPGWLIPVIMEDVVVQSVDDLNAKLNNFKTIKKAKVTAHATPTLLIFRVSIRADAKIEFSEKMVSEFVKQSVIINLQSNEKLKHI